MQRYINEARFGEPKTFKTGAVVGTYPKPLLYLGLDDDGLSVLPDKNEHLPSSYIDVDTCYDDVFHLDPDHLDDVLAQDPSKLPSISALEFFSERGGKLNDEYIPAPSTDGYKAFINVVNTLVTAPKCPYATIVVDPITGLSDIIGNHLAKTDRDKFKDARKWTPAVGFQIAKVMKSLSDLKAHRVFIFHASKVINEKGDITDIRMMVPSQYGRDRVGGLVQQVFYTDIANGKPVVWTKPRGFVRRIGCRWPKGLPDVCGPTYNDLYVTKYNEKGQPIK